MSGVKTSLETSDLFFNNVLQFKIKRVISELDSREQKQSFFILINYFDFIFRTITRNQAVLRIYRNSKKAEIPDNSQFCCLFTGLHRVPAPQMINVLVPLSLSHVYEQKTNIMKICQVSYCNKTKMREAAVFQDDKIKELAPTTFTSWMKYFTQ